MNSIKGKIINYNQEIKGEITFDSKIHEVRETSESVEDYIIPGFVDLHCHGGMGFEVMDGWSSIEEMSKYHLSHGTTSILPTTWTESFENTYNALTGYRENIEKNPNILGIHLEGPFINPHKLGAQPNKALDPDIEFIKKLLEVAEIKIMTLAPELNGIEPLLDFMQKNKIKIQFGHSLAKYDQCIQYMDKYKIGFTHLYNAMSGNDHRDPGVLTAALNHGDFAEIIFDKYHVSTGAFLLAKKCITNLYTVSDSIGVSGLKDGFYTFAGAEIEKKDGKVFQNKTNTLAGSIVTMYQTFLNLIEINCSLPEAVSLTSYNAARYLDESSIGEIHPGKIANIIILDKSFKIKSIYLHGQKINN